MAESIVQSLFGLTPQAIRRQEMADSDAAALQFAQLNPFQRANMQLYQAGGDLARAGAGLIGLQNPQEAMAQQQQSIMSRFDTSTPEGMLQAAQAFNQAGNTDMAYRLSQAAQVMRLRQSQIAENQAQERNALAQAEAAKREKNFQPRAPFTKKEGVAGMPGYIRENTYDSEGKLIARGEPYRMSADISAESREKTAGTKLTKGQEAADREFGKEYAQWNALGGFADVDKQIAQLDRVSGELGKPGNDYTGPVVGQVPDNVRVLSNPAAVNAKNLVEEVAQRNLRLVLGAQFTQVEGERLIARAYNPLLPPSENKKRVDALIRQIKTAAKARDDAAKYFEENGTLAGWKGKMPTVSDFDRAIDSAEKSQGWTIRKKGQ